MYNMLLLMIFKQAQALLRLYLEAQLCSGLASPTVSSFETFPSQACM